MSYDDVVKPAKTGVNIAKNGQGTIGVPGLTVRQDIVGGQSNPVAAAESRLTDRFDDVDYYGAEAESGPSITLFYIEDLNNFTMKFYWNSLGEGYTYDVYLNGGLYDENITSPWTADFYQYGDSLQIKAKLDGNIVYESNILLTEYIGDSQPNNLTATNLTSSSVTVNWSNGGGSFTEYKVYMTNLDTFTTQLVGTTSLTSLNVTDLSIYTSYRFTVAGFIGNIGSSSIPMDVLIEP